VWAGCLSSERYGVPQTRERAILIASRERAVSAPAATHTAYDAALAAGGRWHGTEGDLFGGAGLEPWASMADGLGWGFPDRPAPTVTAGGTEQGGVEVFGNAGTRRRLREVVDAAPWALDRPATTIQGDPRVAQPGHRDREGGERQFAGKSVRITVEEAAALQSFPPGYPWHGRVGDKHRQVGDAVPPRLAAAVIGTCLGLDWQSAVAAHYAGEVAA
jgi:DNA (cytosine-5)-methyltransferase 1